MNLPAFDDAPREAAMLDSMVLLSTLLTAVGVRYDVAERMAGRDPSEQEPEDIAFAYLMDAGAELDELLMRLNASSMYAASHEEEQLSATVRRFDDLLTLRQLARLLHATHQRLLSLYPAVSETVVEEARYLTAFSRSLLENVGRRYEQGIGSFLVRALAFSAGLKQELIG